MQAETKLTMNPLLRLMCVGPSRNLPPVEKMTATKGKCRYDAELVNRTAKDCVYKIKITFPGGVYTHIWLIQNHVVQVVRVSFNELLSPTSVSFTYEGAADLLEGWLNELLHGIYVRNYDPDFHELPVKEVVYKELPPVLFEEIDVNVRNACSINEVGYEISFIIASIVVHDKSDNRKLAILQRWGFTDVAIDRENDILTFNHFGRKVVQDNKKATCIRGGVYLGHSMNLRQVVAACIVIGDKDR
ncbi:hypothetical protein D9_0248 [Aeromonas phage D9]|nr:hypothetical protein D9_0248 [Aeromonas phage D9]